MGDRRGRRGERVEMTKGVTEGGGSDGIGRGTNDEGWM